jgi:thiol-disulfide isomerase/thioredoxin
MMATWITNGAPALRGAGISFLVCAGLAGAALADEDQAELPDLASAMDGRVLRTLDGGSVSIDAPRGRVVVVNFWASWCPPCRKELPFLDQMHRELGGRGVDVLAISIDRETAKARRFVDQNALSLPIYHDPPTGLAAQIHLPQLPATYVIDPAGKTVFLSLGTGPGELNTLRACVERLLGGKSAEVTE